MKTKNKLAVFLTALIVSFSSSATAFEGFSVGATYSSADFSTTGTEIAEGAIGGALTANTTTKTGSGDIGSVFLEYTFSQGSTIGIEHTSGTAEIGKASRTQTSASGDGNAGTLTASASIADPTTFYVEPTWMVNDKFGFYVKGGATRVTVQPKENSDTGSSAALTTSTYGNKDVWGIMTGIGAKAYYNNFFIKAEYVEREFETYSFTSTTGNKNTINADVDTEETRVSIGYNF
jgi:hypothetical protein